MREWNAVWPPSQIDSVAIRNVPTGLCFSVSRYASNSLSNTPTISFPTITKNLPSYCLQDHSGAHNNTSDSSVNCWLIGIALFNAHYSTSVRPRFMTNELAVSWELISRLTLRSSDLRYFCRTGREPGGHAALCLRRRPAAVSRSTAGPAQAEPQR